MPEKATIINFEAIKNTLQKAAYDWAISEQKKFGLIAQPINVLFDKDQILFDEAKVFVSLYYDEKSGKAILRRDWDDGFVVQYNILANYDQLSRIAPKSISKLKQNGIELYKRYCRIRFDCV